MTSFWMVNSLCAVTVPFLQVRIGRGNRRARPVPVRRGGVR